MRLASIDADLLDEVDPPRVGTVAPGVADVEDLDLVLNAAGGVEPHDVLRAATVNGSEILGRSGELGTIEAGKYADLVILAKDPLEDIRNTTSIRQVMKNGRLYEGDTLDEAWPRKRALPPQWFWGDAPPAGPNATNMGLRANPAGTDVR